MSKHIETASTAQGPNRLTAVLGFLLLLSICWAVITGGLASCTGSLRDILQSHDRASENLASQDTARYAIGQMRDLAGQAIEAVSRNQEAGGPIARVPEAGGLAGALAASTNPDGGVLAVGVIVILFVVVLLLKR